jgi:hypothetical protein
MSRRKQPPTIPVEVYRIPALRPRSKRIRVSFSCLYYVSISEASIRVCMISNDNTARVVDLPLSQIDWHWTGEEARSMISVTVPLWLARDRCMI